MLTVVWLCLLGSVSALARPYDLEERASSKPCQPDPFLPRYGFFGGITDSELVFTFLISRYYVHPFTIEVIRFGLDAQHQLVESNKAKVKSFNATFEVCLISFVNS